VSFLLQLEDFDPHSLGLLQRIFLVSDGTLTDTLEAAFLEPVGIVKLAGGTAPATQRIDALNLEPGESVMDRRVLLYGENTKRNYVYAESQLAVDRLPEPFRRELIESDKPLGRLWWEHRLETWKELLTVARRPMGDLARHFPEPGAPPDRGERLILSRSYRLVSGGLPLMVITEYFPA
jgi:chorismate-pyruvate lyase